MNPKKTAHYGHDRLKITAISRIGFEPIKLLALNVDREWVCRPPYYSPPKINSISSEYILSFYLSSPMHSQYYSPNHGY